jgi:hypothetical protein
MQTKRDTGRPAHWLVQGVLSADNTFIRQPGFTSESIAPASLDPRSPLRVELLDEDGRLLLRGGIPLTTPCSDGPGPDPPFRLASGTLPLPAQTRLVRFMLDDVLLEEYRVPAGEPRTVLTEVPKPGARGMARVAWESDHPENVPLTHIVGFSADDGATWDPVGLPTRRNDIEINLDSLPGGERCRVCVKTTDGIHTITTESEPVALPVKPCLAMILAPEPGLKIDQGSTLGLQGQGYWLEDHRPELNALYWSSSLAGALGRGTHLEVSGLEAGLHEITLVAGEGDRAGRASIKVVVVFQ